jgi:hypothetical protein
MYSRLSHLPYTLSRVVAVTRGESSDLEIPFGSRACLFPFNERTLGGALSRILREDGRAAAEASLQDELKVYNGRRATRCGRDILGLRFYALDMARDPAGRVIQKGRTLMAETWAQ